MNREYHIPVSRWKLILPPLIILSQLGVIIGGFTAFAEAPSFKTGWMPVIWVVITICYFLFGFNRFTMSTLVTVEGDSIHVQSCSGKSRSSPSSVTSVTEDQLNYFLDSGSWKSGGAAIPKKRTPPELAEVLDQRIQHQTNHDA